ncbi:hypothetical protein G6M89_18925 [Natronolimnobius sp. AArcel1]|uniref:hypothetical protein n=1 Tax=Natronolimnobius sp. AArcel1 TaxID=1679093 RepID=UPI0013EC52E7|nr:hypothetical protein [Natronolimnobius sp. AArcel1]NGM71052.1 hypothetical protein [Natronolimnobius sp. AArcel1]
MGDEDDGDKIADITNAADPLSLSREYTLDSSHPLAPIPEAEPDVIENEYNIDLTQSDPQKYVPPASVTEPGQAAFVRLATDARDELHESLKLRESTRAVEYVLSLLEQWKKSSDPSYPAPQELERIYRTTFGLETSIRTRPNGPRPPAGPFTSETMGVVQSLYHVTQGLLRVQNGGRITVYRGVRNRTAAELFAQTLDEPERNYFKIDADTVLNATPSKAPAVDIGSNIVFSFCIPTTEIMMAVDQLRTGSTPYSDEYHLRGGKVILDERSVVYTLQNDDMWVPLTRLVAEAINSNQQSERVHDQLFRLVNLAYEKDVQPGTKTGARRLERWVEILRQQALYSRTKRRLARQLVESITDPVSGSAHSLEESTAKE